MTDSIQFATTHFVGFGQFVRTDVIAVMAFAIFHRRDIARARRTLTRARTGMGVPATVRFDSRALFASAEPVTETLATRRLHTMVEALNAIPGMVRYTYLRLADYPDPLDDSDIGKAAKAAIPDVLQQACFAVPAGGVHGPQAHECEALLVDSQNRSSHAHGVLLDLADMVAHAITRTLVDDGSAWILKETDAIKFWSSQEVSVRLEETAGTASSASLKD